jgi:ribosomal protein S7
MPLKRARDEYLGPGLEGVRFLMRDGAKEVACRISLEALTDRGAATGLNEAGVFEAYRNEIEQAASERYDRGQTDYAGGVYVTSVEFPPGRPT